jgi:hypothetical protein
MKLENLYTIDSPTKERTDKPPECKIVPLIYGKGEAGNELITIPRVESGLLSNAAINKLEADIAFLNHQLPNSTMKDHFSWPLNSIPAESFKDFMK